MVSVDFRKASLYTVIHFIEREYSSSGWKTWRSRFGTPMNTQRQDLDKVCKTYGKTFHFWQIDRGDNLPLGLSQMMMSLARDGQLYDELAHEYMARYRRYYNSKFVRLHPTCKTPPVTRLRT
ncbi:hypothetical protein NC651_032545 [Populus alba x Populus x berolinensis]|nr:hypothetical protein NC651_032545 [Populus alba x Populus x berolinensis]